jgi:hypothetical protein
MSRVADFNSAFVLIEGIPVVGLGDQRHVLQALCLINGGTADCAYRLGPDSSTMAISTAASRHPDVVVMNRVRSARP